MSYWQGKVALVTGSSGGFGQSLAKAFAAAGARVMLAARGANRLDQAVHELTAAGFTASGFVADVTRRDDVDAMVAATMDQFGRLDCLVNNVGRSSRGKVLDTSPDEFRELMELNFLSAVRCTQAAVPRLIESRGHIVNIGSLASKSVSRYLGAYPASKFALAAYSQQLRYELNPQGVHVLLACPGPIAREDAGSRYDQQVNDLPRAARQPGGGVKLRGIPPELLATRILLACQRRRAELVIPSKARWLFALAQLCPSLADRILHRQTE